MHKHTFIVFYTLLLCIIHIMKNPRLSGNINGNISNIICFYSFHISLIFIHRGKIIFLGFSFSILPPHTSTGNEYQHSANIYEINRFSNYYFLSDTGYNNSNNEIQKKSCLGWLSASQHFCMRMNKEWIKFMLCCYNISWLFVGNFFFHFSSSFSSLTPSHSIPIDIFTFSNFIHIFLSIFRDH